MSSGQLLDTAFFKLCLEIMKFMETVTFLLLDRFKIFLSADFWLKVGILLDFAENTDISFILHLNKDCFHFYTNCGRKQLIFIHLLILI